jgi:DNA-binding Lrp family transcriptional regulator
MNKVKALAQFNKLNKMFTTVIGLVEDISMLNHDLFLYKEIEIDLDQEKVVGNYDSFKVINIHDAPLEITEDSLNLIAREKILKDYPMERQLSILGGVLEKVAVSAGVECEELKEMNDFINEVRRVNGIRKDFYANNLDYKYMSTEEFNDMIEKMYEGGIQEYGKRTNDL